MELTTRKLRCSAHRTVAELEADITAWIDAWNDDPKPFVWRKTAEEIVAKVRRGRVALRRRSTARANCQHQAP